MIIMVLIIGIPVALFLGRRIGDLFPMLAFCAVAVFDCLALPSVPGSLDACLKPHETCQGHMTWVFALVIVLPLCAAVGIKMLRGDKRGVTGNWRRR